MIVNYYVVPGNVVDEMPRLINGEGSHRTYLEVGVLGSGESLQGWLAERDLA